MRMSKHAVTVAKKLKTADVKFIRAATRFSASALLSIVKSPANVKNVAIVILWKMIAAMMKFNSKSTNMDLTMFRQ